MNYLCICWMTVICSYFWASKRVFILSGSCEELLSSCKLFQISFYKFTSCRLCVLYYLTISLLFSICLMSVTHPQKMNKLKIPSKLFYTPYFNFLTNNTHFPFPIFIYPHENILDAWLKKKLHTTHRLIFLKGTLQKIINTFHNEHV